jgi:hypothetical protein
MSRNAKINPLKFLVFLLPAVIPALLLIPREYNPVTYEWESVIDVNAALYALLAIYPVVSAIVFFKNKILLWSAPAVHLVLTLFSVMLAWGSASVSSMFLAVGLAAIVWSLACSFVALLIKHIKHKNNNDKNSQG